MRHDSPRDLHAKAQKLRAALLEVEGSRSGQSAALVDLRESFNRLAPPSSLEGWTRMSEVERAEFAGKLDAILGGLASVSEEPGVPASLWHIVLLAGGGVLLLVGMLGFLVQGWSESVGSTEFAQSERAEKSVQRTLATRDVARAELRVADIAAKNADDAHAQAEAASAEAHRAFEADRNDRPKAVAAQRADRERDRSRNVAEKRKATRSDAEKNLKRADAKHATAIENLDAMRAKQKPSESRVLLTVILLGAIGGTIRLLASLSLYVGNAQLLRRWLLSYTVLPFIGGAIAVLVYLFIRTGILSPANVRPDGGPPELNLTVIYGFAGATGMFARNAIEKFGEIVDLLFRTAHRKAKDRAGERPIETKSTSGTALTTASPTDAKKPTRTKI